MLLLLTHRPHSCSPVAQALEVSKRLEAGAVAFADNHPVAARQRYDSRERFYGRRRHDILCLFIRFGQWPGDIVHAPLYLHVMSDVLWQVRLLAAQLVALVEKVGDKDKVSSNFNACHCAASRHSRYRCNVSRRTSSRRFWR